MVGRNISFIVLAIGNFFNAGLLYEKEFCRTKLQNSAYALITGGALANMVDRAYNGFVVDFLDFIGILSLSSIQCGRY